MEDVKMQSPNIEILDLLLEHLIEEKIEFATGGKTQSGSSSRSNTRKSQSKSKQKVSTDIPEDIMDNFRSEDEIASSMETTPAQQMGKREQSKEESKIIVREEVVQSPQQGSVNSDNSDEDRSQEPINSKALLINFESGTEDFIPKYTIQSKFSAQSKGL